MTAVLLFVLQGQQPGWAYAIVLGGVVLIASALYALDRWDKKKHGGRRSTAVTRAGGAFLQVQTLLEPGKRHVIVAKETKRAEEDGEGGPDDTSHPDPS